MKKIVLTGGPCGGKTTFLNTLQEQYSSQIVIVPEAATILLSGGFLEPNKDVAWSEEWQTAFEYAVFHLQKSIEEAAVMQAKEKGVSLLVCDRGSLDAAVFLPGGLDQAQILLGLDVHSERLRYDAVVHLESLATADPDNYGLAGNGHRIEPLNRAQKMELLSQNVWSQHKNYHFINGKRSIDQKVADALEIVKEFLEEE
jgi:predicted ATPase